MKIERHTIDRSLAEELFEDAVSALPEYLAEAEKNAKNLDLLIDKAITIVNCGCVVAPDSPQIPHALRLAAQSHAALYAATSAAKQPVTVKLGEKEVIYTSAPDGSTVHVGRWIKGFYLNLPCEDAAGLEILSAVSPESLRRSSTKGSDYSYLYMESLQLMRAGKNEVIDKIIAALESVDPKRHAVADEDWALYIVGQQLEILMYVLTGDAKLGVTIANSLKMHKKYWSKTSTRRRDYRGYISEELTALTLLAKKHGLSCDVESPYLALNLAQINSG